MVVETRKQARRVTKGSCSPRAQKTPHSHWGSGILGSVFLVVKWFRVKVFGVLRVALRASGLQGSSLWLTSGPCKALDSESSVWVLQTPNARTRII